MGNANPRCSQGRSECCVLRRDQRLISAMRSLYRTRAKFRQDVATREEEDLFIWLRRAADQPLLARLPQQPSYDPFPKRHYPKVATSVGSARSLVIGRDAASRHRKSPGDIARTATTKIISFFTLNLNHSLAASRRKPKHHCVRP
jgi:hypothetical protein